MSTNVVTLTRHLYEEGEKLGADLSRLLLQIGYASKILAREIGRAALAGNLGLMGETNATGDNQKKLDVYSNEIVVDALAETGLVAAIVSEELELVKELATDAGYLICMDPLDGSSNTDINGSIGTIFGIYRRQASGASKKNGKPAPGAMTSEMLLRGSDQVVSGYVMYGTSTMLVYTAGHGVHGFTLDRDLGEFLLSHPNITCPARGHYYSANLGHYYEWSAGVQNYVEHMEEKDKATNRPYSLRYTGALVADVHRSLIEGGLYFYPPDAGHPTGKLRLLYECAPLGFLLENAGGSASTGSQRILDIKAESIHQRCPLVIGSKEDVALYEKFVAESGDKAGAKTSK